MAEHPIHHGPESGPTKGEFRRNRVMGDGNKHGNKMPDKKFKRQSGRSTGSVPQVHGQSRARRVT